MVIAWMSNWQYATQLPTKQFRSANSLARDLSLVKDAEGNYRVAVLPSKEVEALRNGKPSVSSFTAGSKAKTVALPSALCEIDLKFVPAQGSKVTVRLSNDEGEYVDLVYDGKSYTCDRSASGITDFNIDFPVLATAPASYDKEQHIRMILDISSLEMFDGKGWWAMTELVFPNTPYNKVQVISEGGNSRVKSLKVYDLKLN